MPTIELWGGPNDGERHEKAAPLPPEWHVPITKPVTLTDVRNPPTTEPIGYDIIRYIRTTRKTQDGKAIMYKYERPKPNGR